MTNIIDSNDEELTTNDLLNRISLQLGVLIKHNESITEREFETDD